MRRLAYFAAALALAGGAFALPLPSSGPVLLGYKGSILPTGVCRTLHCQNVGTFLTDVGYKGYVYKTDGGTLTVYRNAAGLIQGGNIWATADTKVPANQAITKFLRGFVGAKWLPRNQQVCLEGAMYTGRTADRVGFQVACAPNEVGVIIEAFDTRVTARELKAFADSEAKYWGQSEGQGQVTSAPIAVSHKANSRAITGGPWVGCLSAGTLKTVIKYASTYEHDVALAYINGRVDSGECRMFYAGTPVQLHGSLNPTLAKVTAADGRTYWLPTEAVPAN